jgi:hypothetical protein
VSIGDLLVLIGDLAAMVAAWFAFLALGKASHAITEAKDLRQAFDQAVTTATKAASEAATDRQQAAEAAMAERAQAEQQRLARRVERVGEIVEELFWRANEDRTFETDPKHWMDSRNRLRHAIVGLRDRLPRSTEVLNAATAVDAFGQASQARNEVEIQLKYLYGELTRPS